MELRYVVKALRRRWWIVVGLLLVGLLPAAVLRSSAASYESKAVLLVTPPGDAQGQSPYSADPDRYVLGQITVLRSDAVSQQVATKVGQGMSSADVASHLAVTHDPKTDIVRVSATAGTPELARTIATDFLAEYLSVLHTQLDQLQQPQSQLLQREQDQLQTATAALDAQIAGALKPYLPGAGSTGAAAVAVPSVDAIAPQLASARAALQHQYDDVLTAKAQLELGGRLQVTSRIVQPPTLPGSANPRISKSLVAIGLVGGGLVGSLLAIALARLSSEVLDDDELSAGLGVPLFGDFPRSGGLSRRGPPDIAHLSAEVVAFVDRLRARIEAEGGDASTLIVVAGTQRTTGCTTLSIALASRYAASGYDVLLVDADSAQPFLTRTYGLGLDDGDETGPPLSLASDLHGAALDVPGLRLTSGFEVQGGQAFRRHSLPRLGERLRSSAEVVVVDSGALADSSLARGLTEIADVIVMTVPHHGQDRSVLQASADLLAHRRGELVAVAMPVGKPRRIPLPQPRIAAHPEMAAGRS